MSELNKARNLYVIITPARGILGVFTSKNAAVANAGSDDVISIVPVSLVNQLISISGFTPASAAIATYGEWEGEDYEGYEQLAQSQDAEDEAFHEAARARRARYTEDTPVIAPERSVEEILASESTPLTEEEELALEETVVDEIKQPSNVFVSGEGWMPSLGVNS